jgi:soluble lytic murein transglycosylase
MGAFLALAQGVVRADQAATPAHPLAEARTLLDRGAFQEVIQRTEKLVGDLPTYRRWLRAQALVGLGQEGEALEVLNGIAAENRCRPQRPQDPATLEESATDMRCKVLAKTQPRLAAEQVLTLLETPARLLMGAEWLRTAKHPEQALALEVRVLRDWPASAEAKAFAQQVGEKGLRARIATPEDRMLRIHALLEAHENDLVVAESQALLKDLTFASRIQCEATYALGKAYRKQRRYVSATRTLEDARDLCQRTKQQDFAARAALLQIQVLAIRGLLPETIRTVSWLETTYPKHSFLDDALFLNAEVHERNRDTAGASQLYQRIVKQFPTGDHAEEAGFRLAWSAHNQGKTQDALRWLEKTEKAPNLRPMDRDRARYFRAKWLETTAPSKSQELYAGVVRNLGFYAFLTLNSLDERKPTWVDAWKTELTTLRDRNIGSVKPSPVRPSIQATTSEAEELFRAGAPDFAEAALDATRCDPLPPQESLAVAKTYYDIAAFPKAQLVLRPLRTGALARKLPVSPIDYLLQAYSRPFAQAIDAAAQSESIDPLLLIALVREESTFDPEIVSWAGATGLGQLMPATAIGAYADLFGGKRLDITQLIQPDLNLKLAAHVLHDGLRAFRGIVPLGLGAYNGGHGLIRKVLPKEGSLPFDEWIETVRVRETRNYMKRVVESWGVYRWLYTQDDPFIALPKTVSAAAKT